MSIEQDIQRYAKNKDLTADILSIVEFRKASLTDAKQNIRLLKKAIKMLEELVRIDNMLDPLSGSTGYIQAINDKLESYRLSLVILLNICDKGIFEMTIAWDVAMTMYNHDIVPKATNNGQYENLVEEALKAVGIKNTRGVHRFASPVLGNIKSQMESRGDCETAVVQSEIQRDVYEGVRFDGRSPVGYRKMLQFSYS